MGDGVFALDDVLGADDEPSSLLDEEAGDRGGDLVGPSLPSPRAMTWSASTASPGATSSSAPFGIASDVSYDSRLTTLTRVLVSPRMISTTPSMWLISALPLGMRASNSSSTRGRPAVMSRPATPPVWNVRIVSWVPGSPIDWAAMMPTASPMPTSLPVARLRP